MWLLSYSASDQASQVHQDDRKTYTTFLFLNNKGTKREFAPNLVGDIPSLIFLQT
jgi:hypothetical protein